MPTTNWIYETAIDREAEARHLAASPSPVSQPALLETWDCSLPGCQRVFKSADELRAHITTQHRQVDAFLVVDGRVFTESQVVIDWATSDAVVIAVGMQRPSARWTRDHASPLGATDRDSSNPSRSSASGEHRLSLTGALAGSSRGRVSLQVLGGVAPAIFELHVNVPPPLSPSSQAQVERLVDSAMRSLPRIDWTGIREEIAGLPAVERRYGEGLVEYLFGHLQELQHPEFHLPAHRSLERSYSLLRPFATPMGALAQALICFRLGWYDRLESMSQVRQLSEVGAFFKARSETHARNKPSRTPAQRIDASLVVDQFHAKLADAVDAHEAADDETVANLLEDLRATGRLPGNRTNAQQLCILEARHRLVIGDREGAKRRYRELLDDERFVSEARPFA